MNKFVLFLLLPLLMFGCSSKGQITNQVILTEHGSLSSSSSISQGSGADIAILLSFSGGGTRAAALSYGVLEGLRAMEYSNEGESSNLLSQVVAISSVSGGSFTAAYYGLYGEQIFESFEDAFLYRDVSGGLLNLLLKPKYVFSRNTRTIEAADFYNRTLFKNKTFADMREDAPEIIINASDLGSGSRFSFLQEHFDLICSDIDKFSVSNAVAASSAVPIVFQPVVLKNFSQCEGLVIANPDSSSSPHTQNTLRGLQSYADKDDRAYIHLVDGGITDNLGLLAFSDILQSEPFFPNQIESSVKTIVVISVDASTQPERAIDHSIETPSVADTINAVTDIQLHRYNDMSQQIMIEKLTQWERASIGRKALFLDINLNSSTEFEFLNNIPTDFNLNNNEVDALIEHGYQEVFGSASLKKI